MAKESLGEKSTSPKSDSKRPATESQTTSSHSDFQPPSSEVLRSSHAKSLVRVSTSAKIQVSYPKEVDGGKLRRVKDFTSARSNATSARRAKGPQKQPKVRSN